MSWSITLLTEYEFHVRVLFVKPILSVSFKILLEIAYRVSNDTDIGNL